MRAKLGFAAIIGLSLAACHGGSSSLPAHQQASQSHAAVTGTGRATHSIQAYSAAVLADAPIVYYRMNETSGTTAADSSGHGYNGTYGSSVVLGNASLVTGDVAPTFPGGTSSAAKVLRSSSNAALAPTGAMSVEFWVNVPSSVTTNSQILWSQSFANGNASQPGYISLESGTPPFFTMQINTSNGLVSIYPAAVLGAKNHIVMTWNGTTLTGYVNGVVADSATGSGSLVNYTSPYTGFTFGGPSDAHTGFTGSVGEFALYGTALPAARAQAHYNAAINPDPTPPPSSYAATVLADSPVVYYRTNESSGTSAADSSGHAYNGTYGSSVGLGNATLVTGDVAPTFPGGTSSAAKVLRSSTNAALKPTGAQSVEFWVNVPSSVTTNSQILWTQSFANGNASQPGYISLESGTPPFFTMQINTSNGLVSIYPAAVLGAKNHIVMTWNGTTLTGYVNGVVADSATGSGSLVNYTSPYTGFTFGGPVDAHIGFAGAAGEFALYNTALPAARVQAHYNAGAGSSGTVVWQTGGGNIGQYTLPGASDGQCAGVGPTINGGNASFTVLRNTNATYTFRDNTPKPGASTCYRNQMNPIDPNTGTNYELAIGGRYTFTFQTVVTLNGNTAYRDDLPNNHIGADIPAIVWQTHTMNGDPCDTLVIGNTYASYVQGNMQYGTQSPGGQATWNFHSCDDQLPGGPDHSYNSPDTLHDGEVDNWQFDITAQIQGTSGGSIVVQRNGTVVYNAPTSVCDKSGLSPQCWWNFGAYFFYFESSEEPPGWNNAGVTVQVNNMKLVQH